MRALSISNKKGISIMVGYVLLITIAIALSVLVYNWMRFYVSEEEGKSCPDGVSLIIWDYSCSATELNITLKNKGLFNIDGYVLRVSDEEDAELGLYTLNETGSKLGPQESVDFSYDLTSSIEDGYGSPYTLESLTVVDVQPFIYDGEKIFCKKSVAHQELSC